MATFDHLVKYAGVYYAAGTIVPTASGEQAKPAPLPAGEPKSKARVRAKKSEDNGQ